MGQGCGDMPVKCGLSCFLHDVNKEKSNQIDKDIAKEKMYYKRQASYHHIKCFDILMQ